jgi:hypothetical protein
MRTIVPSRPHKPDQPPKSPAKPRFPKRRLSLDVAATRSSDIAPNGAPSPPLPSKRAADTSADIMMGPVESELMRAVRSKSDFVPFFKKLDSTFAWCPPLGNPWPQVMAVQRDLLEIGHHRGPSPMGIVIALTAHRHGRTLVHVDDDFASIARVRSGIEMIRLDERVG